MRLQIYTLDRGYADICLGLRNNLSGVGVDCRGETPVVSKLHKLSPLDTTSLHHAAVLLKIRRGRCTLDGRASYFNQSGLPAIVISVDTKNIVRQPNIELTRLFAMIGVN